MTAKDREAQTQRELDAMRAGDAAAAGLEVLARVGIALPSLKGGYPVQGTGRVELGGCTRALPPGSPRSGTPPPTRCPTSDRRAREHGYGGRHPDARRRDRPQLGHRPLGRRNRPHRVALPASAPGAIGVVILAIRLTGGSILQQTAGVELDVERPT
jgi:hypothetical protein